MTVLCSTAVWPWHILHTALQSQKAVTANSTSRPLLPFGFAPQYTRHLVSDNTWGYSELPPHTAHYYIAS